MKYPGPVYKDGYDEWGQSGYELARLLRSAISVDFTHIKLGGHDIFPQEEASLNQALTFLAAKSDRLPHGWVEAWAKAHPELWEEAKKRILQAMEERFLMSMRLAVHDRAALRVSKERLLEAVAEAHDQWIARSVQEE